MMRSSRQKHVTIGPFELWVHETADENAELEAAIEAGEEPPYGRVLWASAIALCETLLHETRGQPQPNRQVFEVGSGCGLSALLLARLGARVHATDIDAFALSELARAAHAQGLQLTTGRFDVHEPLPAEVGAGHWVVVADLLYEPPLATAVAGRVADAVERGATVFIACPGRVGRRAFVDTLHRRGIAARFVPHPRGPEVACIRPAESGTEG